MLRRLSAPAHPSLVVGTDTSDDAAVWQLDDGRRLVASADFFAPIVDDARTWGRIAAANAASDIYAMGARPLFALNLAAWPRDVLPLELLAEVLAGGADAASDGGWVVAGGHTIDGPEPVYGMSVTGTCEAGDPLLTNAGGSGGQALILTKPLGTGLLATALKRLDAGAVESGGALADSYAAGISEMGRLNDVAAEVAKKHNASAATDVTGFGLLGHLAELAAASGVAAEIEATAVPLLDGAVGLALEGHVPGGTQRNLEHLEDRLDGGDELTRLLLADPQTSGGLLFSVGPERADEQAEQAVRQLCDSGHTAAVIGHLVEGEAGAIRVLGSVEPRGAAGAG